MASKAESDLDAALGSLARELGSAEPRPDPEMFAAVLADAAVTAFATELRATSPRPGPALVARVLADAATVAAERSATRAAPGRPRAGAATRRRGVGEWLFGWTGGAVAAMVLGLAVGLGLGLESRSVALPLLDPVDADPFALAEVEPIVFVDGL